MQTLDPPLVSALTALCAAVLMVYAGVGTRLLSWRPEAVRVRRPPKPRRHWRSSITGGRRGGAGRPGGGCGVQPLVARVPAAPPETPVRRAWLVAAAAVVGAVVVAALAAGWDVTGWLSAVWDSLTSISPVYLVAALALQTLQTAFAAAAWHGILRYAYPESEVRTAASLPATRPVWRSTV